MVDLFPIFLLQLALRSFVGINRSVSRMAVKLDDVIKVLLVTNVDGGRVSTAFTKAELLFNRSY